MTILKHAIMSPKSCAAVLGCAGLVASLTVFAGSRLYTGVDPAIAATEPAFPAGAICHNPSFTARALQLAQTEVSPIARQASPAPASDFENAEPPLWSTLGTISYKISTANAEAQRYFDQGLRLAYGFNHAEARRAFRKAQTLDPECAMCFWGEALVLGPHVNMGMVDEAVAPAWAALTKAKAMASKAAPHEQALIEALSHRYAAAPQKDRAPLDKAYADAMGRVAQQFPDDLNIATLYAEAVMDLSPWDYWKPGGVEPNPQSVPIVPTLERVLAKNPNHAGAIHLYIHAVEASDRPERAEPYADRLVGQMPGAGHMVHMPSHIYYRVGRYKDALKVNIEAAAADEAYLKETGAPPGVYRLGYYPHNVHFVLATGQMSGDGPTVINAAEKLQGLIPEEAAKAVPFVQPIKQAPYYAHAQFSAPEVILALPAPDDGLPFVKAAWHYARGIAFVKKGDAAAAQGELDAISALEKSPALAALIGVGIPANDVLKIAEHVLQGRMAQAKGDASAAVGEFEKAATLQDSLNYMEPPYWYYPVRQSLAAALVQAKRYDAAAEQFRRSLMRAPNNAWSYYGLVELHKARGDAIAMGKAEELLNQSWVGDRALLQLSNL